MKMAERYQFLLCLLSFLLRTVHSQNYEPKVYVCDEITESYGPLPPSVPESFIMKAEVVDKENALAYWEELYFDSPNLRGKYKMIKQGEEKHLIFDYDEEQILMYTVFHPGVAAENDPGSLKSCVASSMEYNPMTEIFGYRYRDGKRTKMYNSFEVLKFGGNYRYAFNVTEPIPERGIPSDVYHGCLISRTSRLDKMFYWSGREKVVPPSGPEQVPVKIETYGEYVAYPKMDGNASAVRIWTVENIPWFERDPIFDDKHFQIPRGMYCKNYRKVKDVPNLPRYFSLRLEEIIFERNMDGELQDVIFEDFTELWYDSEKNLARVDFIPSLGSDEQLFLYMGPVPVSGVYDVSSGVVYYTNKLTGECLPFKIPGNFFLVKKDTRKLVPPNEIFGFDPDKLEYKGKNFARNIPCNVWASQSKSDADSEDFMEVYFSTDGWHVDSDEDEEYGFPVRVTLVEFSVESNKTSEMVSETNIFKYKATQPSPLVYDISGCLNTENQKYFFFLIDKTAKNLLGNHEKLLIAIRDAIKDYSKVESVFRVQNVEIYIPSGEGNVIVRCSLLDIPQLFGDSSKQPGTSLIVAEANLRRAIDKGDFAIAVVVDPKMEPQYIHALPGSLVETIPQAEPQPTGRWDMKIQDTSTKENTKYLYPLDERKDMLQVSYAMFSDSKKDAGYSPGSLGGLAVGMLFLGIILGIGLMYFYLTKYAQPSGSQAIMMHEK